MLSDWEEHRLAEIVEELGSDRALGRVLAAPSRGERLWLFFKAHFYPVGYVLCALGFMVMAMGHDQWVTLAWAVLVAFVSWMVVEWRAAGLRPPL
jgi:hypothetical protein